MRWFPTCVKLAPHSLLLKIPFTLVSNYNGSCYKAISKKKYWRDEKNLNFTAYQLIYHWNYLINWCYQFCYMMWSMGFGNIAQIAILFRKYIKILLNIANFTPNVMAYGLAGTIATMSNQEWWIFMWDLWMVKYQSCLMLSCNFRNERYVDYAG